MKFLFASVATVSILRRVSEAWNVEPRYYGFNVCSPRVLQKQQAMMQKQQSLFQKAFSFYTSPRYEITDTEENFRISVDVPGVNPEDIHVDFEDDGSVLSIRGSRASTSTDENRSFMSRFSQSFSIDSSVDAE